MTRIVKVKTTMHPIFPSALEELAASEEHRSVKIKSQPILQFNFLTIQGKR
jgi:hypothetical protein